MFYTEVVRLVETVDFGIKKFQSEFVCKSQSYRSAALSRGEMQRAPPDIGLMGSASEQVFCVTVLAQKMASNRKTFNMKVVRLVKMVKIASRLVSIRDRLPPQKGPARCSQFKPNSFGKFGQNQSEFDQGFERESKHFPCTGSPAASYIPKG